MRELASLIGVLAMLGFLYAPARAAALDPIDTLTQGEVRFVAGPGLVSQFCCPGPADGDVNGDGRNDLLYLGRHDDTGEFATFVLFSPFAPGTYQMGGPGSQGFEIRGSEDDIRSGAGDVNGDGLDDVLLATPALRAGSPPLRAFVVFGKSSTSTVNLGALGTQGFEMTSNVSVSFQHETSVTALGDVNGDGLGDVSIGAVDRVWVVFGKTSTTPVNLDDLGTGGYEIRLPGSSTLVTTAGAGDFDGDGRPDILVGVGAFPGTSYLVYGKTTTEPVELSVSSAASTTLPGARGGDGAGDVNGDGLGDVIVGSGARAFVVFGRQPRTRVIGVTNLAGKGFAINAPASFAGIFGSGLGDINLDGFDDLVLQAVNQPEPVDRPVAAYVVFGSALAGDVSVTALGTRGFLIHSDFGGAAGVGDVVADPRPDIVVSDTIISPPRDAPEGTCTARGTAGNDVLTGTPGDDVLCGMGGNDTISGLGGDDVVYGGAGDDTLLGGQGDDQVVGGPGADTTDGGAGLDRLTGNAGNDKLLGGPDDDVAVAGDGADLLEGGDGADHLLGSGGPDKVLGQAGPDRLLGDSSVDVVEGGEGDDVLHGGSGHDRLDGGDGADLLDVGGGADAAGDFMQGGAGPDTLQGGPGIDQMNGGDGNDVLQDFHGAPNTLDGGTGDDTLTGGAGNDRLLGGDGVDVIEGSTGADFFDGGAGNDTMNASGFQLDVFHGGPGDDRITAGTGPDVLLGEDGQDVLVGADGADRLTGGLGNDDLDGRAGNDSLIGGPGDDTVVGGPGRDTLSGDAGNDHLDSLDGERDTDRCGTGLDSVTADPIDALDGNCEP